ncbi:MAG: prepilin-type N-terminal cleavage/methylation domain-containing protein [Synechococcus sp. SB0677_bin_5]|nr:prepilin-type N-terminal cleavage/methylation domain-containing protein [Synechococcus sp. SB0677_bin_5]
MTCRTLWSANGSSKVIRPRWPSATRPPACNRHGKACWRSVEVRFVNKPRLPGRARETKAHKEAGFSLVELLVTAVLLSLLAGLVLPRGQNWLARQRRDGAVQSLFHGLEVSRSGAAAKGKACAMALTESGWGEPLNSSSPTCSGIGDLTATAPGLRITANMTQDVEIGPTGLLTGSVGAGGTVVVGHKDLTVERCFVIALPLGTVRTGVYDNDNRKCVKHGKDT